MCVLCLLEVCLPSFLCPYEHRRGRILEWRQPVVIAAYITRRCRRGHAAAALRRNTSLKFTRICYVRESSIQVNTYTHQLERQYLTTKDTHF